MESFSRGGEITEGTEFAVMKRGCSIYFPVFTEVPEILGGGFLNQNFCGNSVEGNNDFEGVIVPVFLYIFLCVILFVSFITGSSGRRRMQGVFLSERIHTLVAGTAAGGYGGFIFPGRKRNRSRQPDGFFYTVKQLE